MDRTVAEVKCRIDGEQNVKASVALTFKVVRECLDILKGAVSIVYPMGLPEYDPVRMELENRDGTGVRIRFIIRFPINQNYCASLTIWHMPKNTCMDE